MHLLKGGSGMKKSSIVWLGPEVCIANLQTCFVCHNIVHIYNKECEFADMHLLLKLSRCALLGFEKEESEYGLFRARP